jgi:RNA-binding protein YlmH
MGRGAMADLIKSGDVRLNWREVKKPSVEVKEGDVVSCAGKGRVTIKSVAENKKGKFVVKYERLL